MSKKQIGKCRLCQNEKELCYSHVLPEFLYLPVYDEIHRASMIPGSKEKYPQKGVREYLLCDCCEGVLNKFETYSSPIIKSIQDLNLSKLGKQYIICDVQYTEFKLFQLSLLWRASVASSEMFESFDIGNHEDIIRKMLLSKKPGMPDQYGCVMILLGKPIYIHKIIWSPVEDEIEGYTCYRFLTGRIFWYFFLPEAYPKYVGSFFLSSEGILRLVKAPWSEKVVIQRIAGIIAGEYFISAKKTKTDSI
jgi:hypothetical protein